MAKKTTTTTTTKRKTTTTTTTRKATTTTTTIKILDTVFTFVDFFQEGYGVTGTMALPNPTTLFRFDKIVGWIGLPANMDIYISNKLFMVITMHDDYLGKLFQLVNNGKLYTGKFINGSIKF